MMGKNGLTATAVGKKPIGMHADGRGLYLRVAPTGARNWIFRYQVNGRRRDMGLGGVDDVSLADARERVDELRKLTRRKVDPLDTARTAQVAEAGQKKRDAWTFRKCALEVHQTLAPGWRNAKHAAQWINTLSTYADPFIGEKPVSSVDVAAVLEVLRPIWTGKPETARRVRQRMEKVLEWAVAHGYAEKNPVPSAVALLPEQKDKATHHAAMPYPDVPAFVLALRAQTLTPSRLAVEFLILTAARSGEIRGARWSEIDRKAKLWTIPARRMKADRDHQVPLSEQALALLDLAAKTFGKQGDSLIFPSGQTGEQMSDMTLAAVLKRMKIAVTVHGFRSSFRDWCSETKVPQEVAERALAHAVRDQTEAAYNRTVLLDLRRPVMRDWAAFVSG